MPRCAAVCIAARRQCRRVGSQPGPSIGPRRFCPGPSIVRHVGAAWRGARIGHLLFCSLLALSASEGGPVWTVCEIFFDDGQPIVVTWKRAASSGSS